VRFSRFSLVGGLCAILSNGLVIALVRYGFTSTAASLLVFGPVLLMGYALHTVFTFSTRPSLLSLVRYTLAMAANLPIWVAALYLLCDVLRVSIAVAAPTTTVLMFIWNYISARWAFLPDVRVALTSLRPDVGRQA